MPTHRAGRHELGQNFLIDQTVIDTVVAVVGKTTGPIIEIGSGGGALTLPMQKLGRPITGVEIDDRTASALRAKVGRSTAIVTRDFLHYPLPRSPHVLVGNLPFHQTTATLRRVLHAPHWTQAVLLVQWEVARRRAGIGGATMMTAQWWPWHAFTLHCRVPAGAFHPRPSVDGGVLTMTRRQAPLVNPAQRKPYQAFVHRVFTGRGHGLWRIIRAAYPQAQASDVRAWLREHGLPDHTLPLDLTANQWATLFTVVG